MMHYWGIDSNIALNQNLSHVAEPINEIDNKLTLII